MSFKVLVKNGTTDYKYDADTGRYDHKEVDYVQEFSTLAAALAEYLYYIDTENGEGDTKVSLVFVPVKDKKAKK